MPAVNGIYTYEPEFVWPFSSESHGWLGPILSIGSLSGNYLIALFVDDAGHTSWISGVITFRDGDEWPIFIAEGYYMNNAAARCAPESGWQSHGGGSPPTLTRGGCLCGAFGDADSDGDTDYLDVRMAYAYVRGTLQLSAGAAYRLDVDGDGDVELDDVQWLAEWQIGMCP